MLRASYGTGFLPANVSQIVQSPTPELLPPIFFVLIGLNDPLRGGEQVGAAGDLIAFFTGGNRISTPRNPKAGRPAWC